MKLVYTTQYQSNKYFVGAVFPTESYGVIEILGRVDFKTYAIRFLNTGYIRTTETGNIAKGQIKDHIAPTVYGVGYLGIGPWVAKKQSKMTPQYNTWFSMLRRCYSGYENGGAVVCDRWHNFQVFCEDLPSIPGYEGWVNKNYVLDKDTRGNSKLYSPDTCSFISHAENVSSGSANYSFHLLSPHGFVHTDVRNMTEFATKHGLCGINLARVCRGEREHHKGWRVYKGNLPATA